MHKGFETGPAAELLAQIRQKSEGRFTLPDGELFNSAISQHIDAYTIHEREELTRLFSRFRMETSAPAAINATSPTEIFRSAPHHEKSKTLAKRNEKSKKRRKQDEMIDARYFSRRLDESLRRQGVSKDHRQHPALNAVCKMIFDFEISAEERNAAIKDVLEAVNTGALRMKVARTLAWLLVDGDILVQDKISSDEEIPYENLRELAEERAYELFGAYYVGKYPRRD